MSLFKWISGELTEKEKRKIKEEAKRDWDLSGWKHLFRPEPTCRLPQPYTGPTVLGELEKINKKLDELLKRKGE